MWDFAGADLQDLKRKILVEGAARLAGAIPAPVINQIDAELTPWLQQINFNDTPGYTLKGHSKWLYNVGLCSRTAVQLVLHEPLLDLLALVFGEEPIVSEMQFQASHDSLPLLPFHSDRNGGILIFVLLSEMNANNGQFAYIPGTQVDNRYFWIPEPELKDKPIVKVEAVAGDVLMFDQDIWHTRFKASTGQRKVLWLMYHPRSRRDAAIDHQLRQSNLQGLSTRQLNALGIGLEPFQRKGTFSHVGRPFSKTDLKNAVRYALWNRSLTLQTPKETSLKNSEAKMVARPARQRAELD